MRTANGIALSCNCTFIPYRAPFAAPSQDLLDQFALPALAESCAFRTAGPGRLEFGRAGPCVMIKVVVVALGTMARAHLRLRCARQGPLRYCVSAG